VISPGFPQITRLQSNMASPYQPPPPPLQDCPSPVFSNHSLVHVYTPWHRERHCEYIIHSTGRYVGTYSCWE